METEPSTGAASGQHQPPAKHQPRTSNQPSTGTSSTQLSEIKVMSNIRTRSELEKVVVNSNISLTIKEELLDYDEYDDYHNEVFIVDKVTGDSDRQDNQSGRNTNNCDTTENRAVPSLVVRKKTVSDNVHRIDIAYNAVRAARKAASSVRSLNSAPVSTERTSSGTLHTTGDYRSARTGSWSDMRQRVSVTCSFDRDTLMCGTCISGRHAALKTAKDGPVAIMASDQAFPPCLPASNGECVRVVRVEDGSLREVTLALADCIGKGTLSNNSVIMLGSMHHMSQVGTAQYCLDWVRSRWWLRERFGEDKVILPASPVPSRVSAARARSAH